MLMRSDLDSTIEQAHHATQRAQRAQLMAREHVKRARAAADDAARRTRHASEATSRLLDDAHRDLGGSTAAVDGAT
jgi:hypothetical protein